MTKRLFSDQQISNYLKVHYDINVTKLLLLPIGADINACVFKVDTKDQSYFVKLKHGHHDEINLNVVELLIQSGI